MLELKARALNPELVDAGSPGSRSSLRSSLIGRSHAGPSNPSLTSGCNQVKGVSSERHAQVGHGFSAIKRNADARPKKKRGPDMTPENGKKGGEIIATDRREPALKITTV